MSKDTTEVIGSLVKTVKDLLNERAESSLSSKLSEGIVIRVHDPVIPINEEVMITYHDSVELIGITGNLQLRPRSKKEYMVTTPDGDSYPIKDISYVEALSAKYQRRVSVATEGRIVICKYNPKIISPTEGMLVLLNSDTGYVSMATEYDELSSASMITNVRRIIDDRHVEIDANRVVYNVDFKLEEGDEILVDASGTIVLKKITSSADSVTSTTPTEKHRVEWNEVIGLNDVKDRIVESIINPIKYQDIYSKYGMDKTPKGMVLAGPPGCGKTMVGRAIATAIADASGSLMTDSGFMYVKSTELLDSFVGESEKKVRTLFTSAVKHYERTGYPGVIFVDEADAVMGTRGRGNSYHSLVAPFLTEMDGFDTQKTFVILATNRLDVIDPAITRNGRLDFKITINRPDKDASGKIINSYLSKTKVSNSIDELVSIAIDNFWSDDAVLHTKTIMGRLMALRARDIVNGAMLKSIVDEAINYAIRREISSIGKSRKVDSGVNYEDMVSAVNSVISQNALLSHDDVWEEFTNK